MRNESSFFQSRYLYLPIYLFYVILCCLFYRGTITICNGKKSPTLKKLGQLMLCQVKNETGSRKFHVSISRYPGKHLRVQISSRKLTKSCEICSDFTITTPERPD